MYLYKFVNQVAIGEPNFYNNHNLCHYCTFPQTHDCPIKQTSTNPRKMHARQRLVLVWLSRMMQLACNGKPKCYILVL